MNERFLRMIVFFDLPTDTATDRREYNKFRRHLIKSGFMMLQESIYCKLLLNATTKNSVMLALHKHKPVKGLVQVLTITEKQFSHIEYLVGEYHGDILNSGDRLVIL